MGGALETGNCFMTIVDEEGRVLPGALATMDAFDAPRVEIADAQGRCQFWRLPPGVYSLEVQLEGYSTLRCPTVSIGVGRNVELEVRLSPAVLEAIE
jgi:hypothetical protein